MTIELPDDIIDMTELTEILNVLVYGNSGVGKTVLAGGTGLILATEKGTLSAKRQGSKAKVWPIRDWEGVRKAYMWLKERCDEGDLPFTWIALDSLEELQQMALRWILDKAVDENASRDPDVPAIQDHQKWQNMFKRFVKLFNDLPVHTLYTATAMLAEDEEGNPVILPSFQGKGIGIASFVCAQMSAVGYMKVANIKVPKPGGDADEKIVKEVRRITWKNSGNVFAKDRSNACGRFTQDRSIAQIGRLMLTVPEAKPVAARKAATTPGTPSKAPSVDATANKAAPVGAGTATAVIEKPIVEDELLDDEE